MTSCLCRTLQYARQNPADFRSSIVEDSSEFYNSGEIFSAETVPLATPAAEVRTGVVRLDRHLKTTESILNLIRCRLRRINFLKNFELKVS